jgi:hypothetical protein
MANQYGYIINQQSFTLGDGDVIWDFVKTNTDGSVTSYDGIETIRDLSAESSVTIIGNANTFINWKNEFNPIETED